MLLDTCQGWWTEILACRRLQRRSQKNPNNVDLQIAYNAAYANAWATATAVIPGVGAVFASQAIAADFSAITHGGNTASNWIALAGNIITLAAQGVELVGGGEVAIALGATTFAITDLIDYVGLIATGAGISLDQDDIKTYLTNAATQQGLMQSADGTYNVSQGPTSSFSLSADGTTTFLRPI